MSNPSNQQPVTAVHR
ncbi:hypothetical protein H9Q73_014392, partial [Fusarium xylarioides]